MTYGVAVGLVGGLGAWLFRLMIGLAHNVLFLGRFGVSYDANTHTPPSPWGAGVVVVPVVGAVCVVYLVRRYAPEARGHGVPEVMDAIYYESGVIRPVVAIVKAVASALSIGSGGSVGREGPIVQIGSAFGSAIGQVRELSVADRQLLIAAGSAAGIAATFNAPLGGMLFAIELLLVRVSARTLLVVGVGVTAGVGVSRHLLGSQTSFTVLELERVEPVSTNWSVLLGLAGLGFLDGVMSAGFIRSFYWAEGQMDRRLRNPYLAHMSGMAIVGLVMYGFLLWLGYYGVEGVGYATITDVLRGDLSSPGVLLALVASKWLVTVLTLGSGASGGIFSPSLFMGATLGGTLGYTLSAAGLPVDPAVFALAGMAGTIAGATGAVLTAVVMVSEMTGDFAVAIPLLMVAVISNAARRLCVRETIYTGKLIRRGRWVPSGLEAATAGVVRARDIMRPEQWEGDKGEARSTIDADGSLFEVIAALHDIDAVFVTDGATPVGVVTRTDVDAELLRLDGAPLYAEEHHRGGRV